MAYASVVYSEHAERRMRERGITPDQVADAIANPDRLTPEGGTLVAERDYPNAPSLRVVFVERVITGGVGVRVITLHHLGRRRRR
jgi:hypothetical protein